jgi:hypothetical protein
MQAAFFWLNIPGSGESRDCATRVHPGPEDMTVPLTSGSNRADYMTIII